MSYNPQHLPHSFRGAAHVAAAWDRHSTVPHAERGGHEQPVSIAQAADSDMLPVRRTAAAASQTWGSGASLPAAFQPLGTHEAQAAMHASDPSIAQHRYVGPSVVQEQRGLAYVAVGHPVPGSGIFSNHQAGPSTVEASAPAVFSINVSGHARIGALAVTPRPVTKAHALR